MKHIPISEYTDIFCITTEHQTNSSEPCDEQYNKHKLQDIDVFLFRLFFLGLIKENDILIICTICVSTGCIELVHALAYTIRKNDTLYVEIYAFTDHTYGSYENLFSCLLFASFCRARVILFQSLFRIQFY